MIYICRELMSLSEKLACVISAAVVAGKALLPITARAQRQHNASGVRELLIICLLPRTIWTALNWFRQQIPRNLTVVKGLEIRAALRRPRCSLTSSRISAGLRGRKLNLQLIIAQDRHLIRPWVRHQMRQMMNGYPNFFNLLSKVKAQEAWTRFLLPVASNLSLTVWI